MSDEVWRKIDDRLHAVELQISLVLNSLRAELGVNGSVGNVPRMIGGMRAELREVRAHLLGTLNEPGIVMRLDRLEIAEQRRTRLLSTLIVTLISLVVKAFWDLIAA